MREIVCLEPSKKKGWLIALRALQVGFDIAFLLLFYVICGLLLDRWLGTKALFLMIFSLTAIWQCFKKFLHMGDDRHE